MNELAITGAKFCITDQGVDFTGDLSREEWDDVGIKVARVGKSIGFIIGDWFNYGNHKWGGDGRKGGMYADAILPMHNPSRTAFWVFAERVLY